MKTTRYRLRIIKDDCRTYIVRDTAGRVSYISGDETPLALCNLIPHGAAEIRFILEDCKDGNAAAKAVRDVLAAYWQNNLPCMPRVEIV